jgi:16S rRNA (guanine1207-N2)-methyltransferase
MRRRRGGEAVDFAEASALLGNRLRPPFAVVLGSPRETAELVAALGTDETACWQMDLFQADRLQEELGERGSGARVMTAADLWDLPNDFQTVLYPVPSVGERSLKLDLIEQAFHILRPHGTLVVLSPHEKDQLFAAALKKIYGRVHTPPLTSGTLFWCQRDGDRPRRRHEVTFQVRFADNTSLRFLSRPGTFSYGRFDNGARALVETMAIRDGDDILDIGCGCGTNGVWAARLAGPEGSVAFIDSNLRAVTLAEHNARENDVAAFQAISTRAVDGVPESAFDVALANPPYYAFSSIARLFIVRARLLLRPGGRFYLVTKQPDQVGPVVADEFGTTEVVTRRGYNVLCAQAAD